MMMKDMKSLQQEISEAHASHCARVRLDPFGTHLFLFWPQVRTFMLRYVVCMMIFVCCLPDVFLLRTPV